MSKNLSQKAKSVKGVSLAMGIFSAFFNPNAEAFTQQKDILHLVNQVKQVSIQLSEQLNQSSEIKAIFVELAKLTETVALLNAVVRRMKSPEKVLDDLLFIDLVLAKLASSIRTDYLEHFRTALDDRATFKKYVNEIAHFNLFAITLRQTQGRYVVVPSEAVFTQENLDALIADSNKRYGVNG